MTLRSHDSPHYINVTRRTLYCSYFDDNYANVMDDEGNEESILITKQDLIKKQDEFEDGCDVTLMDIDFELNDEKISYTIVTEIKETSE